MNSSDAEQSHKKELLPKRLGKLRLWHLAVPATPLGCGTSLARARTMTTTGAAMRTVSVVKSKITEFCSKDLLCLQLRGFSELGEDSGPSGREEQEPGKEFESPLLPGQEMVAGRKKQNNSEGVFASRY